MAAALLPDSLWDLVEPFLPTPPRRPKRRTAARFRSRVSHRHSVCPSQRHPLTTAPAGGRVWVGMFTSGVIGATGAKTPPPVDEALRYKRSADHAHSQRRLSVSL